ncbi:hypothetical protein EPJ69_03140 [Brachyspira aalborgi]|uniref:Membrane protein YkvI n=1 Tax=Brachyspira aalborgi TaxID=29522 RepID=A0A5C8E862_9SPIR|nr:hypothetical protein [Brachyspira aalborgi]TXJ33955.1 hypothetical protein EPJ69_03140 [Brachyspira aalborgi]
MPEDKKISINNVIMFGGSIIAFLIGSGFATGQEVLQYFTAYGFWGMAGTLVMFIVFLYVCSSFILVGYDNTFEKPNDVYIYYCGKYIGTFFDYFSTLFIYMSYFVMIAGAGATMKQQYGISEVIGAIVMAILSGVTVAFGLKNIVKVLGKLGPIICIISIFLGIYGIVTNFSGLAEGNRIVGELQKTKASTNWFFSSASYIGFCMLWLTAFVAALGKQANSKKEGVLGAFFGTFGFSIAVIIVALGLLAHINEVANSQIPSLILASKISTIFATVFSVIVIGGIYTTAVPLLWTASSRVVSDDSSGKFKIVTIILAAVGCFIGLKIPFDKLVNIVYVLNGYVGFLLFFIMLIKSIIRIKNKNNIKNI